MSLVNFLNLILDDEWSCFSPNPYRTDIKPEPHPEDIFFSINALKGRRLDSNVQNYRNLLLEIDGMPLEEQENYVRSAIPVTSQVFSGSKSYHFIVSLETPLKDAEEYRNVWLRLQKLLPKIDKACKNPSRLSRLPYRTRPETGLEQKLHFLGSRIKTEEFLAMLPELEYSVEQRNAERKLIPVNLMGLCLNPDLAIEKIGLAGRNAFFHYLYERLKEMGKSKADTKFYIDLAYEKLGNKTGFSRAEAYSAARIK